MDKYAWRAKVLPGKLEEYIRRHNKIWSEMTETLNKAGIHNYSIWSNGDDLFGYFECKSLLFAQKILAEDPAAYRWREYMKDVMVAETDSETNNSIGLIQVFNHE